MLAITVTDDLRARSQPRVAENSVKYAPLLPKGTQLTVLGGPVDASGYTWVEVAPVGFALRGGVDSGWVAIADHDGTPWVAPAADDTPGYELASVRVDRRAPRLADAKAAAVAQNAFGIALYKRMLRDPVLNLAGKGVVMSPYSIVTALAMARAGAKGDTAVEIDKVLRVTDWNSLGAGLNALDQKLTSRDAAWTDYENKQHWLKLRTANMGFAQDGYAIDPVYLERIAETFGAGAGLVDYIHDKDGALAAINGWVSRQTVGRIPKLLVPENLTEDTRLVLVNAVYLKAEWESPFDPGQTGRRTFTTLAGKQVKVPTMTRTGDQDMVLATGDGWRATELRYRGAEDKSPLAITLVMPDDLRAFERSLSPELLAKVQARVRAEEKRQQKVEYTGSGDMDCGEYAYNVRLFLPKFGTDTRAKLNEPLAAMGMRLAFNRLAADFSGITTADQLYIAMVIHQANIDVDEAGTEAAAATAVGMETGGCTGPDPRTTEVLRFNKPFLYVIRDVETGAILFMGRVVDPTVRS
jgi:serpin B